MKNNEEGAVRNDIRIDWSSCRDLYWSWKIRHEPGNCTFEIRAKQKSMKLLCFILFFMMLRKKIDVQKRALASVHFHLPSRILSVTLIAYE